MTSSQDVWMHRFTAALESLPLDQQHIVRYATADLIESVVPVLQELSENQQRTILQGLSNLVLAAVPPGASRKVVGEHVPVDARIDTVLNQLRADPVKANPPRKAP